MLSPDLISPATNTLEQAPAASPAPESGIPAPVAGMLAGKPPALQFGPESQGDPTVSWLQSNFDELTSAGVDFTDLEDGRSVIFNSALTTAEQINAAAADGSLDSIAPPIGAVSAPPAAPAGPAQGDSGLSPALLAPAQSIALKPPTEAELRPVVQARSDQVRARTPTEQPIPAGGFQNNLNKRAV